MAKVNLNGVELYYETEGEGERIVLTHGAWSDGRTWQPVAGRLADRFEVLMWDRRGHSRSQASEGQGSVREDASDLAAVIQHVGDEPVHLVGNSSGGSVVLNLVTMRPDLARSAAAHEPGPLALLEGTKDRHVAHLMDREKRKIRYVNELLAGGEHRRAAEYFVDEVAVGPGAWVQLPEQMRGILESNAETVSDDLRDSFNAASIDLEVLAATNVPLLISSGADSPELEAAAARELGRLIPTARLEAIEGSGHIPHRTHPDEYAAMLTAFIDGATQASSVNVTTEGSV